MSTETETDAAARTAAGESALAAETATGETAATPLADLHRRLGGTPAPAGAPVAVAGYGEFEAEVAALRERAGLLDRWPVGRLRVTGEDRARFLQGLVTCDVAALEPGRGAYGFFTTIKGRILADAAVLATADALLLELPPGAGTAVREHLSKYRIADRVEFEAADDLAPLAVAGPAAAEVLGVTPPEEPWASTEVEVGGVPVRVVRQGHLGVEGFTLWAPADRAGELAAALLERERDRLSPVGHEAAEAVRIEAGVPRFGADFDADNFPQETGLGEEAVSYEKGCYLGQEVVARIHYRGGVNRGLRGLRLTPPEGAEPAPGAQLFHDGRPAGRLGSAVRSPAAGGWIGLSVLHQRAGEPGTVLEIEGGGEAEVAALPFV
jgi:folate-binding protein YgfZ